MLAELTVTSPQLAAVFGAGFCTGAVLVGWRPAVEAFMRGADPPVRLDRLVAPTGREHAAETVMLVSDRPKPYNWEEADV